MVRVADDDDATVKLFKRLPSLKSVLDSLITDGSLREVTRDLENSRLPRTRMGHEGSANQLVGLKGLSFELNKGKPCQHCILIDFILETL